MGKYKLFIKPTAVKEIETVSNRKIRRQIVSRIMSLVENPRPTGCEKLSIQHKYRLRKGKYRIVYSVDDSLLEVVIFKVGHRKDVYR